MPHARRYFRIPAAEWTRKAIQRWQRDDYYRSTAGFGYRHVRVQECNRKTHISFEKDRVNHAHLNMLNQSHSVSTARAIGKAISSGKLSQSEAKDLSAAARRCNWHKHDKDAFPPLSGSGGKEAWADVQDDTDAACAFSAFGGLEFTHLVEDDADGGDADFHHHLRCNLKRLWVAVLPRPSCALFKCPITIVWKFC